MLDANVYTWKLVKSASKTVSKLESGLKLAQIKNDVFEMKIPYANS